MALNVKFTITQASDGTKITFQETTGAYDASTNTTGYGGSTIAHSAITDTRFQFTPQGSAEFEVTKSYLPAQAASPNGSVDFSISDFSQSGATLEDGVYALKYSVYGVALSGNSGVVNGTEYIVTANSSGNVVYNGTTYTYGQVFTGTSTGSYTSNGSAHPAPLVDSSTCYFILTHNAFESIKKIMINIAEEDACSCDSEKLRKTGEVYMRYAAILLAFQAGYYDASNTQIKKIKTRSEEMCLKCC